MNILKYLENKRGEQAIIVVVATLIFVTLFSFFVDTLLINVKFSSVSQAAETVARVASRQGGILDKKPSDFEGSYIAQNEMRNIIAETFASSGIVEDDVTFEVNGRNILKNETKQFDYGDMITVSVKIDYQWRLLGAITGDHSNKTYSVSRAVISEYKPRYDNWEGDL